MLDIQIRDCAIKIHVSEDTNPATVSPRSTNIVKALQVGTRIVVREDYYQFVSGSNVYCVVSAGRHIWDAEVPMAGDAYANPVFLDSGVLTCHSWNGITCAVGPEFGKILSSELTM